MKSLSPIHANRTGNASNTLDKKSTLSTQHQHRPRSRPRELEVARFNNTLLQGDEIRIFSYYWRIEDFQSKLLANVSQIDSPIFSISGLHLRVRAVLNHLQRDYLYLQLVAVPHVRINEDDDNDVSLDEDTDSNVVLESGTMFQAIKTREYFRHKIVILDQVGL